jgi:hypothetical protein
MYDCFDTTPDVSGTRYTAIMPTQSIAEQNTASSAMASTSARLPWKQMDLVPQALSDEILWHALHGSGSTPPAPGPNASPIEHLRTTIARRLLRSHGNVRAYLRRTGGDPDG